MTRTTTRPTADTALGSARASELLPARQQPDWPDPAHTDRVRAVLADRPPLVGVDSVRTLRGLLARAAEGEFAVLQAGDCAEDPAECTLASVAPKIEMLDTLAEIMRAGAGTPVLRIGRFAGQFAKPRSQDHEDVDGVRLPVFRGELVNSVEADPVARTPDPERVLAGHDSARSVLDAVEMLGRGTAVDAPDRVWASHEALLLDYEVPQLRPTPDGGVYLSSTHLPWIGERTRQVDGAHVRLLSRVLNPVACKVGPAMTEADLVALCEVLDPDREPGRLTLIPRFGHAGIGLLGPLVRAVRAAGHPVLWVCDPMHGNTVKARDGLKTRRLEDIMGEIRGFLDTVAANGGNPVGLHLETAVAEVSECEGVGVAPVAGPRYRTLCDPRLNRTQSVAAAAHWHTGGHREVT